MVRKSAQKFFSLKTHGNTYLLIGALMESKSMKQTLIKNINNKLKLKNAKQNLIAQYPKTREIFSP